MNEFSQRKYEFVNAEGQCASLALWCGHLALLASRVVWSCTEGAQLQKWQNQSFSHLPLTDIGQAKILSLKFWQHCVLLWCVFGRKVVLESHSYRNKNLILMTYNTHSLSSFPSFEIYILISGLIFFNRQIFLLLPNGFHSQTKNLCAHRLSIGIRYLVSSNWCTDKIQSIVLPSYFSRPTKDLSWCGTAHAECQTITSTQNYTCKERCFTVLENLKKHGRH